ncbi:MAG: AraC family transcriptional regulator [Terrimicrobiaceae bacterium]
MPPDSSILHLGEASWCRALRDNRTVCRVDLRGVSGRFLTPRRWDTGTLRLNEHLVYYFSEHGALAEVNGVACPCPQGTCCWIYPGSRFRFTSRDGQPSLIYRFRFSARRGRSALAPRGRFVLRKDAGAAFKTIEDLLREGMRRDTWSGERIRSLLMLFSIEMFSSRSPGSSRGVLTLFQQEKLRAFIESRHGVPTPPPGPRDLARVAGLSPDYFARHFRQTYGVSPRRWILQERLRHAAVLLDESTIRVGEVAERLGYANYHLFSRQFKAFHGLSPRAWRRRG